MSFSTSNTDNSNEFSSVLYLLIKLSLVFFCLNSFLVISIVFIGVGSFNYIKLFIGLAALSSVIYIFFNINNFKIIKSDLFLLLIIFNFFLVTFSQVLIYPNMYDDLGRSSHAYLIGSTVYNLSYMLIGCSFSKLKNIEKSNVKSISLLLILFFFIASYLKDGVVIDYNSLGLSNLDTDIPANHLLAGPYLFLAIVFFYCLSHGPIKLFSFFLATLILFMLGGRADLALFILSVLLYECLKEFSVFRFLKYITLAFILLIVLMLIGNFFSDNSLVQRMLFNNAGGPDTSFIERIEQLYIGLNNLNNQIFFGDVSYIAKTQGSFGDYIHNIISVWQFYGLFSLLLIIIIMKIMVKNIIFLAKKSNTANSDFIILIGISALLGILLAKSIISVVFWVAVGAVLGKVNSTRKCNA